MLCIYYFRLFPILKFYNWLPVFLEKAQGVYQATGTNFSYLQLAFFLLLSFEILVISLLYLLGDYYYFFFFVECRVLGLLLCTKSKKYTWCVSLPIVWWELPEVLLIYLYNLHIYKLSPEGSFEMMLSMSMKD